MDYFSIKQTFLSLCLSLDDDMAKHLDDFIRLLKKSGVEKFLKQPSFNGRTGYKLDRLLATCLLGFAFGTGTLRDLKKAKQKKSLTRKQRMNTNIIENKRLSVSMFN